MTDSTTTGAATLKENVREKYGQAALRVVDAGETACCGLVNSCCGGAAFDGTVDPITANLYINGETDVLPEAAVLASLGCGNPTALAELHEGEEVLDLGSGGGIDVLLSARRVGPTGKAYGLDMTDEMLALARVNAAKAGATNVEFLKGEIEAIPLPDNSVDVIISNCVINLSGDKPRVLAEAFRVLKPGGRFAVSDVVVRGAIPAAMKQSMELWIGFWLAHSRNRSSRGCSRRSGLPTSRSSRRASIRSMTRVRFSPGPGSTLTRSHHRSRGDS